MIIDPAGGTDSAAIHDNVDGEIAAVAAVGTLSLVDLFLLEDVDDSEAKKRVTAEEIAELATDVLVWTFNGNVSTSTAQDGFRAVTKPGTILGVIISVLNRGAAATDLICDIFKHVPAGAITTQQDNTSGVSIYNVTPANRPTIVGAAPTSQNAIFQTPTPDVEAFVAGDFFSMDVVQSGANDAGLCVQLFLRYSS